MSQNSKIGVPVPGVTYQQACEMSYQEALEAQEWTDKQREEMSGIALPDREKLQNYALLAQSHAATSLALAQLALALKD